MSTQTQTKAQILKQFSTGYERAFAQRVAQLGCKLRYPSNGYTNYRITYLPRTKAEEVMQFVSKTWCSNIAGLKVVSNKDIEKQYGTVILIIPAKVMRLCPNLKAALEEFVPVKADEERHTPDLKTQMPLTESNYPEPESTQEQVNLAETLKVLRSLSVKELKAKAKQHGYTGYSRLSKSQLIELLMSN